jgi:hypothetical protein
MFSPITDQRPLLPELARVERGQQELLADLVHLLAHDGDDLVQRALAEKEIVVNARAQLADIAGAEQEFVAGDLGVRRSLAEGRNKEFRPTMHTKSTPSPKDHADAARPRPVPRHPPPPAK